MKVELSHKCLSLFMHCHKHTILLMHSIVISRHGEVAIKIHNTSWWTQGYYSLTEQPILLQQGSSAMRSWKCPSTTSLQSRSRPASGGGSSLGRGFSVCFCRCFFPILLPSLPLYHPLCLCRRCGRYYSSSFYKLLLASAAVHGKQRSVLLFIYYYLSQQ